MIRHLSLLAGLTVLAATLCSTATAQEYSNGGICRNRQEATKTPVEAFGVHPPGLDPADAHRFFHRWRHMWIPYYAPVAPVATSARWKPWCYFPLMPWYTPYYMGYCPKRLHNPPPAPYGSNPWGDGPMPDPNCKIPPPGMYLHYGVYTSILQDDTIFWNMGGNGLVPYGTPRPPHNGPPDLVDAIQITRQGGPGGVDGSCGAPPIAPPVAPGAAMTGMAPPPIVPAAEKPDAEQPAGNQPDMQKPDAESPKSPD